MGEIVALRTGVRGGERATLTCMKAARRPSRSRWLICPWKAAAATPFPWQLAVVVAGAGGAQTGL